MPSVIVVGMQWGDEGKGKVIDLLTSEARAIVRAQGGNNAGHTVIVGKEEYKLHLIPSGILQPQTECFIGAGTVIDPSVLLEEMDGLKNRGITVDGRLWISTAAHVIFPYHRICDSLYEETKGSRRIGTTGRGIGPCYADKANRIGIRMGEFVRPDLLEKALRTVVTMKNAELTNLYQSEPIDIEQLLAEQLQLADRLRPFVKGIEKTVYDLVVTQQENVLLEGAQGTFLDSSTGTYPFVTSSNTVAAGICAGAGLGPSHIDQTLGIIKSYTTRVGNGPLPSETSEDEIFMDPSKGREIGVTTGRQRRIGWFDAVLARQAVRVNGATALALTKLDILDHAERIKICVAYELDGQQIDELPSVAEDLERVKPLYESLPGWKMSTREIRNYEALPENARRYIERIETLCGIPISILSVGPARDETLIIDNIFRRKEATV